MEGCEGCGGSGSMKDWGRNVPNEGGLNKRNGSTIDGRHLGCMHTVRSPSLPLAPHLALIDELCEREVRIL